MRGWFCFDFSRVALKSRALGFFDGYYLVVGHPSLRARVRRERVPDLKAFPFPDSCKALTKFPPVVRNCLFPLPGSNIYVFLRRAARFITNFGLPACGFRSVSCFALE